ncbi:WxL protein peptidoglycan domain-containing protein [Streptomyces boncukensis]|uniref:DUF916 domain-containing protein n=1 Tax=Streptomyces boncukensis TaxID=2711219 RepID=A0A6G4WRT7_9ACTN|nr:DUF916 domain-containing protein [Streptomyces boncukensis]NGO67723.1 DUF916 domain-containing protein [Streptomyces boncukensis]
MRTYALPTPAVLLVLLSLLLGALAVPGAPHAHAADNGRWAVFPAKATEERAVQGAGKRAVFRLRADPGATLREKVTVANRVNRPMTFLLYGADAHNTPRDGGFAVRTHAEKQRDVGKWTRLKHREVTVPARGEKTVPFAVEVPAKAEPGDHAGAVVAVDKRVAKAKGAVGVGVQQAVGSRIHLRVNGERTDRLEVRDVRFDYATPLLPGSGQDATIGYTLANTGNTMLRPQVDIKAAGLLGRRPFSTTGKKLPAELLPGQRVEVTQKWSGPPLVDWGTVRVTASDRDGRIVESGSDGYRTVSWWLLLVLLVPVAWAAGRLVRRWRRGRS